MLQHMQECMQYSFRAVLTRRPAVHSSASALLPLLLLLLPASTAPCPDRPQTPPAWLAHQAARLLVLLPNARFVLRAFTSP
jgi:hypothetical protein